MNGAIETPMKRDRSSTHPSWSVRTRVTTIPVATMMDEANCQACAPAFG